MFNSYCCQNSCYYSSNACWWFYTRNKIYGWQFLTNLLVSVHIWLLARCKCFKYIDIWFCFQQQKKWSPLKINTTTCLLDMNDHFVLKKNFKIIWKEARRLCESELNWLINSANIFTFVVSFCASGQLTLF